MDRFFWSDGQLAVDEQLIFQQSGVRIYDGTSKTAFDNGRLSLTSHRFLWKDYKDPKCQLAMSLACVVRVEEEASTLTKSSKIVLHLTAPDASKPTGPVVSSAFSYIRFSFQEAGQREMLRCVMEALHRKRWMQTLAGPAAAPGGAGQLKSGISGIERNIAKRHTEADKTISAAFEDLSALMDKAREMVALSGNISAKIREKQGEITDDETVQFKSHLLSLGIADPVTRDTHGSGANYYRELARQVSEAMLRPLEQAGGAPMTLTDVYCRINRARGMELLSPEDLLHACRALEELQLPVVLRVFDSGVMVLQLRAHSEAAVVAETQRVITSAGSMSADELSRSVSGLSVVLARERLLTAERLGKLCRDESTQGLRFYPNKFFSSAA